MIEKIEAALYAPPVKNFVTAHPYVVVGVLALVISSLMLLPLLRKLRQSK